MVGGAWATNVNTSAPADDPGWLTWATFVITGQSLGDHGEPLGANAVHNFPGLARFTCVGQRVRLQNPSGLGCRPIHDLPQIGCTDPGLPGLRLPTAPPILARINSYRRQGSGDPQYDGNPWTVTGRRQIWVLGGQAGGEKTGGATLTLAAYAANTAAEDVWARTFLMTMTLFFAMTLAVLHPRHFGGNGDVLSFYDRIRQSGRNDRRVLPTMSATLSGDSEAPCLRKDGVVWVLPAAPAIGSFCNHRR